MIAGHDADDVGVDFGLDGDTAPTKSVHGGAGGAGGDTRSKPGDASVGKGKRKKGPGSKKGSEFGSIFAESFGIGASVFAESVTGPDDDVFPSEGVPL